MDEQANIDILHRIHSIVSPPAVLTSSNDPRQAPSWPLADVIANAVVFHSIHSVYLSFR